MRTKRGKEGWGDYFQKRWGKRSFSLNIKQFLPVKNRNTNFIYVFVILPQSERTDLAVEYIPNWIVLKPYIPQYNWAVSQNTTALWMSVQNNKE
jgi:hypothetical protein